MSKILVFGDSFIDLYVHGNANRISQEAPVPVLNYTHKIHRLGGAGNTAANIASLGCDVMLITEVNPKDQFGKLFIDLCIDYGIEIKNFGYSKLTATKSRFCGQQGQQMLRVDFEDTSPSLVTAETGDLFSVLGTLIKNFDAVIISDYAKGFVRSRFVKEVAHHCKFAGIPLIIDPKPALNKVYEGMTYITPNEVEMLGMKSSNCLSNDPLEVAKEYSVAEGCGVLLTQGAEGITLVKEGQVVFHDEAKAKTVFDVTGAGDTVVAAFAVKLAQGASEEEAVVFANKAAGIAVSKRGTTTVTLEEVNELK